MSISRHITAPDHRHERRPIRISGALASRRPSHVSDAHALETFGINSRPSEREPLMARARACGGGGGGGGWLAGWLAARAWAELSARAALSHACRRRANADRQGGRRRRRGPVRARRHLIAIQTITALWARGPTARARRPRRRQRRRRRRRRGATFPHTFETRPGHARRGHVRRAWPIRRAGRRDEPPIGRRVRSGRREAFDERGVCGREVLTDGAAGVGTDDDRGDDDGRIHRRDRWRWRQRDGVRGARGEDDGRRRGRLRGAP